MLNKLEITSGQYRQSPNAKHRNYITENLTRAFHSEVLDNQRRQHQIDSLAFTNQLVRSLVTPNPLIRYR